MMKIGYVEIKLKRLRVGKWLKVIKIEKMKDIEEGKLKDI